MSMYHNINMPATIEHPLDNIQTLLSTTECY